jgi:hypothetical protein
MTDRCHGVRELLPELAMGVAAGDERAAALAHVDTCDDCRGQLEETTAVVDGLFLLAPEHEPPPGFESRVLTTIAGGAPARHRRRTFWLAAVAAVALVAIGAAGVTRWAGADDRRLADQYRQTLEVADGSYLRAAELVDGSGSTTGHVFAYQGKPSWLFMTVQGAPSGTFDVTMVTGDGRRHDLGECWVSGGKGSWGTSIDVPVWTVDRVEMRDSNGVVMAASFQR